MIKKNTQTRLSVKFEFQIDSEVFVYSYFNIVMMLIIYETYISEIIYCLSKVPK